MRNSYRRAFSPYKLNNILLFGLFKRTSVYYSKYDNYNVPKPFLLYFHKTLIYPTHYDKVICFILSSHTPSSWLSSNTTDYRVLTFLVEFCNCFVFRLSPNCCSTFITFINIVIILYLKLYSCLRLYYTANKNIITSLRVTFGAFPMLPEIKMFTCLPLFN